MDSEMPSGMLSGVLGKLVHSSLANTAVSQGKVAPLNPKYSLPHFIEGDVLTRRPNCESSSQMV